MLFQAFGWDAESQKGPGHWYEHLKELVPGLRQSGVTHIWIPPVSRSVSPQGYMPGDYYDLGTPENPTFYGHIDSLRELIDTIHKHGMHAVADIVINHRTASHQEDGIWNVFHHASNQMMWEKWALARGDYGGTGAKDSGGDFAPAPDIDHSNRRVRADIINWLNWLRDYVGFDGFRFDYTKGFAGKYVQEYVEKTGAGFCVGEYWTSMNYNGSTLLPNQDSHRQEITDWVDQTEGTCSTFDFTSKGLLQEAVGNQEFWRLKDRKGKAAGMLGWWPDRSVTFVDNHDTGSTQAHWPFPSHRLASGYAYILTHPGIPTVFYEHYMDSDLRSVTDKLIALRNRLGIEPGTAMEILQASDGIYVAKIGDHLIVKLGSAFYHPGDPWSLEIVGEEFAVWSFPF